MSASATAVSEPVLRNKLTIKHAVIRLLRYFSTHRGIPVALYCFFQKLVAPVTLIIYWFSMHLQTRVLSYEWLSSTRFSCADVLLLLCVMICAKYTNQGRWVTFPDSLVNLFTRINLSCASCGALILIYWNMYLPFGQAATRAINFTLLTIATSCVLLTSAYVLQYAVCFFGIEKQSVVIVGSGLKAESMFYEFINSTEYEILGIVDDEFIGNEEMRKFYLGKISSLKSLIKLHPVKTVYCTLPLRSKYEQAQKAISLCEMSGVEVRYSTRVFNTTIARISSAQEYSDDFSTLHTVRHHWTRGIKRLIDILGAGSLLLIASPIMLAAAVGIKLTDGGPVFFAQERYGLNRRRFRIFKLRTMVVNAEALMVKLEEKNEMRDGPAFKMKNDPRVTKIGAFLRKSSIDELPQLWNIIKGDMSLVGPRPLAVRDVMLMDEFSQLRRFSVIPGLTCIWQVSGRNNVDFDTWLRQDLDYIDRWSLLLDIRILLKTVPTVLLGHGAM